MEIHIELEQVANMTLTEETTRDTNSKLKVYKALQWPPNKMCRNAHKHTVYQVQSVPYLSGAQ